MAARKPAKKAAKKAAQQSALAAEFAQPVATRTRHSYSEEEKAAALEAVVVCGNVAEAARKLGIAEDTLRSWTLGSNVSDEVYKDYKDNAHARVQERVEAMHATKDEVLSLYAIHLRGDVADFEGILKDDGSIDLKLAKQRGVSRLIKKIRSVPTKLGMIREIEFYSSKDSADSLSAVLGLNKQAAENPDTIEKRQAFWRTQIEKVMAAKGLEEGDAREWLLRNVSAAQAEQQYLM